MACHLQEARAGGQGVRTSKWDLSPGLLTVQYLISPSLFPSESQGRKDLGPI